MTNTTEQLIKDIEAFCRLKKIAPTTFGNRVMKDSRFVERLRNGTAMIGTVERVRSIDWNEATK